jgi:hypothetical protein
MAKDLANFHKQWQRMSKQPGAEMITEYILYNQTVNYMDNTIYILDAFNNTQTTYNVQFLKTFDSTGATEHYIGAVRGRGQPHFSGAGPLVIVSNCAFFQLFVIDPRGLVPNKTEEVELEIMYKPFMNMPTYDEDTTASERSMPEFPSEDTSSFTEVERQAVIAAHRNKDVCNPLLRAQSNTTLVYFSRINTTLVLCLGNYLSCSLRYTGDSYANLTCTSSCTLFMPGNTTCQVNQQPKQLCDPFSGPVQLLASIEYADLTVTTFNTVNHEAKVVLRLKLPPHY